MPDGMHPGGSPTRSSTEPARGPSAGIGAATQPLAVTIFRG
jgi:hypothetical protein